MRHITTLLILIFSTSIFAQNNVVKTAGVSYTAGGPTFSPGKYGSQVAIDTVTGLWYEHNGTSWSASGYRIQTISGCSAPAYTPAKYQSRLVINACTAGQGGPELYYWNGSAWLQINEGQTYTAGTGIDITGGVISATSTGGPDSTFSEIDGTYTGKRITSNVFRNGTTGFRTNDTTGIINIVRPLTETKWGAYFGGAWGNYMQFQKEPGPGVDPQITNFNFGRAFFPDIVNSGDNQVVSMGFNVAANGSLEDPTQANMRLGFENNYRNSISDPLQYEIHIPEIRYPSGAVRRPFSGIYSNDETRIQGTTLLTVDRLNLFDYKTDSQKAFWTFAENSGSKGISFLDTAGLYFYKNNQYAIQQRNAANTQFVSVLKVDNLDRILLGGFGESRIAAFNVFQVTNSGKVFNENGTINVGDATNKTDLYVYGTNTNIPLRLTGGLSGRQWGWEIGGASYAFRDLTSGGTPLYVYNSSTVGDFIFRNQNLGVGVVPGFFPEARIHSYNSGGATSKLLALENSTGRSTFYRSSATPATGSVTDVTITNISGVGDVWIHDGTAHRALAKVIKATATLDFGSTAAGESTDLTVTVAGASVGDPVGVGLPASPNANSCFTAWVSASDTVTVRFNNYQLLTAIDPASASYKVIVTKY